MDYQKIKTSVSDGIAVVTLSDPSTLNAAGIDLVRELRHACDSFTKEGSGVRCLVITGEGRGFCSGANLSGRESSGETSADERDSGAALESIYNPLVSLLRDYPMPIVTAINGAAAGVGCSIALLGDLIVASESAYFMQAFRRIGLVPDGGSTYMLPRLIGRARAMEMALLGERVPAATALQWGMINRCVPDADLMSTALELAKALATGPKSLAWTRKLIWESLDADWHSQLWAERVKQRDAGRTEDSIEGVMAFLQKRPAEFKGK